MLLRRSSETGLPGSLTWHPRIDKPPISTGVPLRATECVVLGGRVTFIGLVWSWIPVVLGYKEFSLAIDRKDFRPTLM